MDWTKMYFEIYNLTKMCLSNVETFHYLHPSQSKRWTNTRTHEYVHYQFAQIKQKSNYHLTVRSSTVHNIKH